MLDPPDTGVFHVLRRHPRGAFLAVHNVTPQVRRVPWSLLEECGLGRGGAAVADRLSGAPPPVRDGAVVLPAYAVAWLTD